MKACRQAELDLPWYVNGTLDEAARASLEAHLPVCSRCQALLVGEQRLAVALRAHDTRAHDTRVVPLHAGSWSDFERRLDATAASIAAVSRADDDAPARPIAGPPTAPRSARSRWGLAGRVPRRALLLAVAAQAVALVVLAGLLRLSPPATVPVYRTVTNAEPGIVSDRPLVRVVVAPGVTLARVDDLAQRAGMSIVTGPRAGNIFTLAMHGARGRTAAATMGAALQALRAHPEVLLAEQVSDGAPLAEPRP